MALLHFESESPSLAGARAEEKHDRAGRLPASWIALASLAVVLRLIFWQFTGRVWEDALISVLHSENLFRGLGLSHLHADGIPVHGFTSPISVLVPLIGDFFHIGLGLTLIRLVSALAGGLTVLVGMSIAEQLSFPRFFVWAFGFYLACEYHQILWGMSGMETQLVTLTLLASIWNLNARGPALRTGILMGCCLLARPDFLFWVVIMGCILAHRWSQHTGWASKVGKLFTGFAVTYLPWLVFTSLYYGSPVPNTILAKSAGYPLWSAHLDGPFTLFVTPVSRSVFELFAPLGIVYGGNGTGFVSFDVHLFEVAASVLLLTGIVISFRAKDSRSIPVATFLVVYALYYDLLVANIFGWYCVPICAAGALIALYALNHFASLSKDWKLFVKLAVGCYILALLLLLPIEFRSERNIQRYVEDGVRKQIALYIRTHSGPGETIGLEPLGYMAYYSGRQVYDYPGLVDRQTVQFLTNNPSKKRIDYLLEYRRPDWIVLRRNEYQLLFATNPANRWLLSCYSRIREFKVDNQFHQGTLSPEANIDTDFLVFRKNSTVRPGEIRSEGRGNS